MRSENQKQMLFKLVWLSICIYNLKAKNILIRDLSGSCYLEKAFQENFVVFPEDLQISIHLTRIPGLLFYSIDKNFNQLIVKIHDEFDPFLIIKFNVKKSLVSLRKLCKCEQCMYETLNFRFRIKNGVTAQCNGGYEFNNKYSPNQKFHPKYPIPRFDKNNVSAYMWLINIPESEKMGSIIYPENEFLTGCIYKISHNYVPITMVPSGAGISDKCIKKCNDRICNGGKCLETFESKPICDCFDTYWNGEFCNSTHVTTDMVTDGFQFEVLKICWRSHLNDILLIKNKFVLLAILIEDKHLCIKYLDESVYRKQCLNVIQGNYLFGYEYILLLTLEHQLLDIQIKLHLNDSWTRIQIPINRTLNKEVFDKIVFLNNSQHEIGEVVFKVSKRETRWRHIGNNIRGNNQNENNSIRKLRTKFSNKIIFRNYPFLYLIIGIAIGSFITVIVWIVVICTCPSCIPICLRSKIRIPLRTEDQLKNSNAELLKTSGPIRRRTDALRSSCDNDRGSTDMYIRANGYLNRSTDVLGKSYDSWRMSNDVLIRNNDPRRRSNTSLKSNDPRRRSQNIFENSANNLHLLPNNVISNRWSRADL